MIKLKHILSELLLQEALPISLAREYTSVDRNKSIQQRLNSIFNKLRRLPNATASKRNDRVYLPFKSESLEDEVKAILQGTEYTLTNYEKGIVTDKYGREQKLTRVIKRLDKEGVAGKDKDELLDKINSDSRKDYSNTMLVFSKHPYDIAGMSSGREWTSCMNVYDGAFARYIQRDVKEGTLICYLTTNDDQNLNNPLSRILIKPYINIANKRDVLYHPEQRKVYGVDVPRDFKEKVNQIMASVQEGKRGRFKMSDKLYCDSPGNYSVEIKDTTLQGYLDGTEQPKTQKDVKTILTYLGVEGFTINPDLSVDVRRDVDLRYSKLSVIPVKFRKVGGDFFCEGNKLTSFKNAPEEVSGDFRCFGNKISSTDGFPKKIGGLVDVGNNQLSDFEKKWIQQNTEAKEFIF